jgi:hypothetical protein
MPKDEFLTHVTQLASQGLISEDELLAAYRKGKGEKHDQTVTKRLSVAEILYFVGGAIVFIGIGILVYQNWEVLNAFTRILATLGSSVAAYVVGVLFGRYEKLDGVSQAFYLISALVAPIGLAIAYDEAVLDFSEYGIQTLISGILLTTYLLSYFVFRKTLFIVFSVIFGTWLFFSFTSWLVDSRLKFDELEFYEYRILLVGLSYILLGYTFAQHKIVALSHWLYGFGIFGFLGAALALGGWSPNQNVFWELIFPALALGSMFISIHLKSRAFLTFGSLYLMVYLLKITPEYFSNTLGWPLALVLAGFSLIGIGYGSFYLNKKYLY